MITRLIILLLFLLTWTPINGLFQIVSYVGPLVVLFLGVALGVLGLSRVDLPLLFLGGLAAVGGSIFYRDTGWLHPALGVLTYSSLLALAVRFRNTTVARQTFINLTAYFTILEGSLGIAQLYFQEGGLRFRSSMAAGDAVVGTLGTNAHLFAVKMLFQGLFLFFVWQWARRKPKQRIVSSKILLVGVALAFVSALLASALLSTVIFFVTIVPSLIGWRSLLVRMLTLRLRPIWLLVGIGGIILITFFLITQQNNAALISRNFRAFFQEGPEANPIAFQKVIVFEESVREVLFDNLKTATFGVGLGRYSSRAAMFLSGGYLRDQPDLIPISRSPQTDTHIYPRWNPDVWHIYGGSIMGMPTNSVQSVLIEFGLIGFWMMLSYFGFLVWRAYRRVRRSPSGLAAVYLQMVLPFLAALGTISLTDLWLEYPQLTVNVYLVIALALSHQRALSVRETPTV